MTSRYVNRSEVATFLGGEPALVAAAGGGEDAEKVIAQAIRAAELEATGYLDGVFELPTVPEDTPEGLKTILGEALPFFIKMFANRERLDEMDRSLQQRVIQRYREIRDGQYQIAGLVRKDSSAASAGDTGSARRVGGSVRPGRRRAFQSGDFAGMEPGA